MNEQSIVHWFDERDAHQCGYCKSPAGSVRFGMWAQSLTVDDYQNLIDRGWRRSGQYCYKPAMNETCCPSYTIKCDSKQFHAMKSQKKVMKNMSKFLRTGELKKPKQLGDHSVESQDESINDIEYILECPNPKVEIDQQKLGNDSNVKSIEMDNSSVGNSKNEEINCKVYKKGDGADPSKPPCKKAKVMRMERKLKKQEVPPSSAEKIPPDVNKPIREKTLEDFLDNEATDYKFKLKTVLIDPSDPESDWNKFEQLEYELFKKYQNVIHNDPPHKNTLSGFLRFLVNTPLQSRPVKNSTISYGSYHQQYWLNETLIAVGVIDILPKCISAVYFFYDPDYRELTLGTYSALKEIQLARELTPTLNTEYYYMGYYIHSCPKMKYKGNMHPSFLLCPETYNWVPIEKAVVKLEMSKYSRLNEDLDATDENETTLSDLDEMKIVVGNQFMRYGKCKRYLDKNEAKYSNIGELVGKKCIKSLFFVES